MMLRIGLLALVALGLSTAGASAEVKVVSGVHVSAPRAQGGGEVIVQDITFPAFEIKSGDEISFAELTFDEELAVRTEVEVWPAVADNNAPWELPEIVSEFGRNFWVVDDRTGSFVKFDVTAIMKAWSTESLPNLGFELQIIVDPDVAQQESALSAMSRDVSIRYITSPIVKSIPMVRDGKGDERRKHESSLEDGSSGH